eukprot:g11416.t1
MAADLALFEELQVAAGGDPDDAEEGEAAEAESGSALVSEFLIGAADFGKTGVADLDQQEKYVGDFFGNIRPRSKWAVRVKVIADSCQLACGALGYSLKNVEKRLFLTSRLYGSQSNAINEAVDDAVKHGKLQTDSAVVLDDADLGAYRQFVQMFQLHDLEAAGAAEIFPSREIVFVLEPLDGWSDVAGACDRKKLIEAGAKALRKVFSKPTNPSMTRFATAATAAAEQVHMYIYQSKVGGAMAWDEWKRKWASPHIGGGSRFTFEEDEKECRCVCAVVAVCAYAGNRLQKRVMNKATRASWREMWEKCKVNLEEALALGRSEEFWKLLDVKPDDAAPFIAAIEVACLAQLATAEHQIICRFSYDRMMGELHGAATSRWSSIVDKCRQLVGAQIKYNDATERSVLRLAEIVGRFMLVTKHI